ncbi:MAG: AAA family ATPase, partial [Rhodospirillales bacterium]|nr:AAA family ATPase [Rhodospirillales bacterium]
MRLDRLDLLRYGRFNGTSIALPRAAPDIHILFGPNEAGKTTSLTAIGDLLFGIPERSPYSFLHGYDTMRIGAVLENGGNCIEFQRRKGRRDRILGPDGEPLPGDEGVLEPFLGGADRVYFDRMFNLSHGRLAEGGRTILEAKDDVGRMLFAAGTGLADLRQRLKQLEEEADGLWASRKSGRRLYYQAQDRWQEAQSRQRQHSLTVRDWQTARKILSDAGKTLEQRRQAEEAVSKELKKLARIRRVHAAVRRRRALTEKIAALGAVAVLAEDAAEQLARAERQDAEIGGKIAVLAPQLEKDRQALEAIAFDEALVRRADEIAQLDEQRIAVRSERKDLPKRQHEFHLELEALAKLAAEIGWEFDDPGALIGRIPPRSKVEPLRRLLARHGELTAELRGAHRAREEAQAGLQEKTKCLEEIGEAADVSGLAAVLNAVRGIGDVAGRIRTAQLHAAGIAEDIERKLRSLKPALPSGADIEQRSQLPQGPRLKPALPSGADIEALAVPPEDSVVAHRDAVRSWAQRRDGTKQRHSEACNSLVRDREALERCVRDEGAVAPGAVREARGYRDRLWALVKTRYIEGLQIPAEAAQAHAEALKDLPGSLEAAVERADAIADRRFDKAQLTAESAVLARNIAGHETSIRQLEAEAAALQADGEQLDRTWHALWAELPLAVLAPDAMLAWLAAREEIVTLIGRERDLRRQLAGSRQEEQEARDQVRAALTKAGRDAGEIGADTLQAEVEWAEAYRQEQEAKARRIDAAREALRSAKSELARRQGALTNARTELESWQADWAQAVAAIDLRCDGKPEGVSAQIGLLDRMREHAKTAADLRDKRIAAIDRDIAIFEDAVAEIAAELAPDLTDGDAEASALELNRRREEALTLHRQHGELTAAVDKGRKQIDDLQKSREAGWAPVQPLLKAAAAGDAGELREAIALSDRCRALNEELAGVMQTLDRQGDGLAIEVLEEECRDLDIDEVQVREDAAEAEREVLGRQREEAFAALTKAEKTFEAMGGGDAAARAAADCQEALAAMQDAAERYVRVRASAILLRWAVERYRQEKQGPLLKRAGALFRLLTRNSFARLEVGFDRRDSMHLTGVRPDGETVAVAGLSTGTEDQLFLALRIAAGLEPLQRGRVTMAGLEVAGPSRILPPERRSIGLVFQDYALFPHLSVADNVAFGLRGLGAEARRRRVEGCLRQVGMAHAAAAFPHTLSGGQQQRVALARAL